MQKINKLILIVILLCSSIGVIAQSTNSPYSRYGYGMLNDRSVGLSRGMGGISYGLRSNLSANPGNPASYSKVDSLTFILDFGVSYSNVRLDDGTNKINKDNGGLDYITMLMPLSKRVGFSFGLIPFSSVGYKYGKVQDLDGVTYRESHEGSGGFSQLYGGVAYEPFNGLSVGANVSYMFGTLKHDRSVPSISDGLQSDPYTSFQYRKFRLNSPKVDFGVQYEMPLSKIQTLTLGAVFSPKMTGRGKITQNTYKVNSSSGSMMTGDTISHAGLDVGFPMAIGFGVTYARDNRLLLGADVTYEAWEKVNTDTLINDGMLSKDRFNNRWKVNAGIEYCINPYERSIFKRMKFRGGINYSNSYMNVLNADGRIGGYKQYGATIGFGIPIRDHIFSDRTSYLNINFEYTKLKGDMSNMVNEQYFGVSVNVNINELWFMRRKFK